MHNLKEVLEKYIAQNKTETAANILLNIIDIYIAEPNDNTDEIKIFRNNIILVLASLNETQQNIRLGIVSNKDAKITTTRNNYAFMQILDDLLKINDFSDFAGKQQSLFIIENKDSAISAVNRESKLIQNQKIKEEAQNLLKQFEIENKSILDNTANYKETKNTINKFILLTIVFAVILLLILYFVV